MLYDKNKRIINFEENVGYYMDEMILGTMNVIFYPPSRKRSKTSHLRDRNGLPIFVFYEKKYIYKASTIDWPIFNQVT